MGTPCSMTFAKPSDKGGQPTGTTEPATALRSRETASPRRKICTSCPASAEAFAWWKANEACVGSAEPQALLMRIFILQGTRLRSRSLLSSSSVYPALSFHDLE